MDHKNDHLRMPRTVDEAAELIISDLLVQHLRALSQMNEEDFDSLCEKVTPHLLDEFNLWQGNNMLVESCLHQAEKGDEDPARTILSAVKKKLRNLNCFLFIT